MAMVLILASVAGGMMIFQVFRTQVEVITRTASLREQSIDLTVASTGCAAAVTVKNNGTVPLENVTVRIMDPEGDNVDLVVGDLDPAETGGAHVVGDWSFKIGESYPALMTALGQEGDVLISKTTKVRAR